MMKYFVILKDSIREAADSKVLYVLLGLSTLAILFVATVGFTPLSAEKTFMQFFVEPPMPGQMASLPPKMILMLAKSTGGAELDQRIQRALPVYSCNLDQVELIEGAANSPLSTYALTITYRGFDAGQDNKATELVQDIFGEAQAMGFLRIGDVSTIAGARDRNTLRLRLTIHGTGATHRIWATEPSVLFGLSEISILTFPLGMQIMILSSLFIGLGSWIAILVSVVITSFFIPNMLHKGTVDMLLVKPTRRWILLLYKYVGGLVFVLVATAFGMAGMVIVLGLRSGVWGFEALLLVPTLVFFFAILYSISTLVGVTTRNTIASILLTILAWGIFFAIGHQESQITKQREKEEALVKYKLASPDEPHSTEGGLVKAVHLLYLCTPHTEDLNSLNSSIIFCAFVSGNLSDIGTVGCRGIVWWESTLVSVAWIVIFLALACWRFSRKDY